MYRYFKNMHALKVTNLLHPRYITFRFCSDVSRELRNFCITLVTEVTYLLASVLRNTYIVFLTGKEASY